MPRQPVKADVGYSRPTHQALKHEKHGYLARAGPYAEVTRDDALLGERVEGLVSREDSVWSATQTGACVGGSGRTDV